VISPHESNGFFASSLEDRPLLRRTLYIVFFIEIGLLLVVLPWSPYWERNYFVALYPALEMLLTNDFVRGAVSGLGLLNIAAGLTQILPPPDSHR
jgi:hypothetical protein